jgi:hypothetical protein
MVRKQWHLPVLLFIGWAILCGMAFLLLAQRLPTISDPIGYVYAAERLANGQGLTHEDANNQFGPTYFSLYAFQIRRSDDLRMYLGFPPGLPILLTAGILLTERATAVHYVVPLLAMVGLVAAFALGWLWLEDVWGGWWTAVLLTTAAIYWEFGTAAWSEVPSLLFVTGGYVFYLLSRQAEQPSSQRHLFAILGALFLSFSLFLRYANITFLVALGLYELVIARKRLWQEKERWLFFGLLALGIIAIPVFNHFYYGGASLTSYSPEHGWYPLPAFSPAYALGPSFVNGYSLLEAGKTLWRTYPVVLILAPLGWFLMKRGLGLLAALAIGGSVALYGMYAFAPVGINARFIIPVLPFLAVSLSAVLLRVAEITPGSKLRWVGGAALLLLCLLPIRKQVTALQTRNQQDQITATAVQQLTSFSPENAVFLSYSRNDLIAYYGKRSVLNYRRIPPSDAEAGQYRFEWLEPCLVETANRLLAADIPVYYVAEAGTSWNPIDILQTHFQLEIVQESPTVYQLVAPLASETQLSCPP